MCIGCQSTLTSCVLWIMVVGSQPCFSPAACSPGPPSGSSEHPLPKEHLRAIGSTMAIELNARFFSTSSCTTNYESKLIRWIVIANSNLICIFLIIFRRHYVYVELKVMEHAVVPGN